MRRTAPHFTESTLHDVLLRDQCRRRRLESCPTTHTHPPTQAISKMPSRFRHSGTVQAVGPIMASDNPLRGRFVAPHHGPTAVPQILDRLAWLRGVDGVPVALACRLTRGADHGPNRCPGLVTAVGSSTDAKLGDPRPTAGRSGRRFRAHGSSTPRASRHHRRPSWRRPT